MIIFTVVLILAVCIQNSSALTCMGCEISNSSEPCNFSYKCPKGTEYCETLISKVKGSYSVILSCATMEKCGKHSSDQGLEKCDHEESNTECFSCCKKNKCNGLKETYEELPYDIFELHNTSLDEQSELYDHEDQEDQEDQEDHNDSNLEIEDELEELEDLIETDEKKLNIDEYDQPQNTKERTELHNHEESNLETDKILQELETMIENDKENLDKEVNTNEEIYNNTDLATPTVEATNEYNVSSIAAPVEEITNSTEVSISPEVSTLAPLNVSEYINEETVEEAEENLEEPPVFIDDEDEEFQGEHHAFKGSSSMLRVECSLLAVTSLFIGVRQIFN